MRETEHASRTIDLQTVVRGSAAGEPNSIEHLFNFLRPRIAKKTAGLNTSDGSDVESTILSKIFTHLDTFNPTLGRGSFEHNFLAWSNRITVNTINSELRRQYRQKTFEQTNRIVEPSASDEPETVDLVDLMPALKDRISQMVTEPQFQVVNLSLGGLNYRQISDRLQIREGAVRERLSQARKKIEENLITPAGFKRLSSFENTKLYSQAYYKTLEAVKFLGVWYATERSVKRALLHQREVDPTLLDEGYVLLSQSTSASEYYLLQMHKYRPMLRHKNNRFYIKEEDLAKFRRTRKKARPRRLPLANTGYKALSTFCDTTTMSQYLMLERAARKGNMEAVKKGSFWFVTQEAVDKFMSAHKTHFSDMVKS